jgi:hypothetical protein
MIIDCHGHYTTAPPELGEYRDRQKAQLERDPGHEGVKGVINIGDDQIRESLEGAQLKLQRVNTGPNTATNSFIELQSSIRKTLPGSRNYRNRRVLACRQALRSWNAV